MIYPWQPVIFSWVWTLPNWMDFHRKLSSFGGYFRRVQGCPRQSNSSRQFAWVTIFIKFWFLWVCLHRIIKLRGVEQRFASAGVVLVGGSFWKPRVFKKNIGFFWNPTNSSGSEVQGIYIHILGSVSMLKFRGSFPPFKNTPFPTEAEFCPGLVKESTLKL